MAEDLISSIIDTAAIERQVETVSAYLDTLKEKIKAIQVAQPDIKINDVKELAAANNQLNQSLQGLNQTSTQLTASQGKLAQMQQQVTTAVQQNTSSLQDNIQARIRVKNSIDSYLKSQKEDLLLLKAGTITHDEYNKRLVDSNIKIEQFKNKLLVLNKEIKNQTLTTQQQGGAYALLNKEYVAAQANAKNLAVIYGIQSKEAKTAAATALALNKELQAIDKTVGLSQRNVGNYGGAFQKAFSGIRTIANVLPGLGLSGVVLLLATPFITLAENIDFAGKSLRKFIEDRKLLNDVTLEANRSSAKEITDLKLVYDATQNLTLSQNKRVEAAKYLQATYPETFKNFTTEQILLGSAKSAYDDLTKSILKNALASAAKNKLAELSNQELDVFTKYAEKRKGLQDEISRTYITKSDDQIMAENGLVNKAQLERFKKNAAILAEARRKNINESVNEYEDSVKSIREKQKLLIDFVGAESLIESIFTGSKNGKSDSSSLKVKEISDNTGKEILQSLFNINKRAIQLNIDKNKEIAESDKYNYAQRINALKEYAVAVEALVELELQYELATEKLRYDSVIEGLEKQKKEKGANIEAINDQEEKELAASIARKRDIQSKADLENINRIKNQAKILDDIDKDQEKKNQLRGLDSVKAYYKEKDRLAEESAKKQKAIADQLAKDEAAANKQLIQELQTTFFAFLQNSLTRQQQNLEEKQRLLGEDTERQINQIELLGLSEVERTRRIAEVQKDAAFQNEQIEKRKREIAVQRAKFEKAQSVTSIIQSTAQAVVAALGNKPYSPANIFLATTVGAIGALQLARALAAPLPKYAKGTDSAKAGFAIAGEIGAELVTERSGRQYLTPAVPTLMHFKGGEKITPADLTADILNAANMKSLATMQPKGSYSQNDINSHLLQDAVTQLKYLNRKKQPGWNIQHGIEATPWYNQHFKS